MNLNRIKIQNKNNYNKIIKIYNYLIKVQNNKKKLMKNYLNLL